MNREIFLFILGLILFVIGIIGVKRNNPLDDGYVYLLSFTFLIILGVVLIIYYGCDLLGIEFFKKIETQNNGSSLISDYYYLFPIYLVVFLSIFSMKNKK